MLMSKKANNRRFQIREILKYRTESSAMTIREIHCELQNRGFDCVKKTIERDIKDLSSSYGLCSIGKKPERFFSPGNFNFNQNISLDYYSLQTLFMALQNLKRTSHYYFSDQVDECESVLMNSLNRELVEELKYSREKFYFDYGLSGRPVGDDVQGIKKVLLALREERIVKCKNISPYKSGEYNKRYRMLAPLYFVLSSGMPYLMAIDMEDNEGLVKRFRMTRLKEVEILGPFSKDLKDVKYDHEKSIGGWGGTGMKCEEVKILATEKVGTFFIEKNLHPTQTVEKLSNDDFLIKLNVPLSDELIRNLASFGGNILHVSPQHLFDKITGIWESGVKKKKSN